MPIQNMCLIDMSIDIAFLIDMSIEIALDQILFVRAADRSWDSGVG